MTTTNQYYIRHRSKKNMTWTKSIGPFFCFGAWNAAVAYAKTLENNGKYRDIFCEVAWRRDANEKPMSAVTIRIRIHYDEGHQQKTNATNLWMHGGAKQCTG